MNNTHNHKENEKKKEGIARIRCCYYIIDTVVVVAVNCSRFKQRQKEQIKWNGTKRKKESKQWKEKSNIDLLVHSNLQWLPVYFSGFACFTFCGAFSFFDFRIFLLPSFSFSTCNFLLNVLFVCEKSEKTNKYFIIYFIKMMGGWVDLTVYSILSLALFHYITEREKKLLSDWCWSKYYYEFELMIFSSLAIHSCINVAIREEVHKLS